MKRTLTDATQRVRDDLAATMAAQLDDEHPPPPTAPDAEALARLLIGAAAWGAPVPLEAADLFSDNDEHRAAALDGVLGALEAAAGELEARAMTVRTALDAAGLAGGARQGSRAATAPPSVLGGALARMVGDATVPIGAPLPVELLGVDLAPVAGTPGEDWLETIAEVRPRVAELAAAMADLGVLGDAGLVLRAGLPDDPWRIIALESAADRVGENAADVAAPPRFEAVVTVETVGEIAEWIVLDSFVEVVPDPRTALGLAFDTATPGAAPPHAVLLAPSPEVDTPLRPEDLPGAVLQARAMARARMVDAAAVAGAGLGPLGAFAALPQYEEGGLPLTEQGTRSRFEDVAFLASLTTKADADDVVAAVTADPLWMLGVQWRLGEHLGEDAASPIQVDTAMTVAKLPAEVADKPAEATVGSEDNWDPTDLAYSATLAAGGATLTVERHTAGPLDWWALTADAVPAGGPDSAESVPSRVDWPGAPRRRYWQIEDARRDPAGAGPDVTHPATLHLIRLLARHGDDWYVAPLAASLGTVVHPVDVTLIDAAGGRWTLKTPPDWSLFAVAGLDPPPPPHTDPRWHRGLPVLASAAAALAGPITDEVAFAVDEEANLVWAAIQRRAGIEPDPGEAAPILIRTTEPGRGPLDVDWELAGPVPSNRVPYLYGGADESRAFGAGEDRFVQALLLDPDTGHPLPTPPSVILTPPPGDIAHTLQPLAIPSSGVRVLQQPVLARDVHGAPVRWERRALVPLDRTIDVPLRWDIVTLRQT